MVYFHKESQPVKIDVTIENETDLAFLVNDGDRSVWIPKSQLIGFDWDAPIMMPITAMTITIPEWLAKAKGLI